MFLATKIKGALAKKAKAARSITKTDVKQFAKNCIPTLLCLGVYMIPSLAGANTTDVATSVKIEPLQKPLEVITNALTGPIPILVTGGGIALGGMSWAMGWEQQAMMRGVKVAGGGAVAMMAGKFIESTLETGTGQTLAEGLLFF